MKMDRKHLMIYAAAAGGLFLLYYLYSRNSAANNATSTQNPGTDTVGTALSPNASDYATLSGDLQQSQATESYDVFKLGQQIKYLAGALSGANRRNNRLAAEVAAGQKRDARLEKEIRKLMHQKKYGGGKSFLGHHHPPWVTGGGGLYRADHDHHHHTNHHHPKGTGGAAVGKRSHAPSHGKHRAQEHRHRHNTRARPNR